MGKGHCPVDYGGYFVCAQIAELKKVFPHLYVAPFYI